MNTPHSLSPSVLAIVDDDPRIRSFLALTLEEYGVDADFYENSFDLLQSVSIAKPKLILVDLMMPHMDGIECCRRLRSLNFTGGLLVVSALMDQQMVSSALEAGADAYVVKSEIFDDLTSVLSRYGCIPS